MIPVLTVCEQTSPVNRTNLKTSVRHCLSGLLYTYQIITGKSEQIAAWRQIWNFTHNIHENYRKCL